MNSQRKMATNRQTSEDDTGQDINSEDHDGVPYATTLGTVFIEARVKDNFIGDHEEVCYSTSDSHNVFSLSTTPGTKHSF